MRDYEEWHQTKNELPPIGEVIEGVNPKDWRYSELQRDYFALVVTNDELSWMTPGLNNMEYKELKITHWRFIPPDPKGRRPFIKIKIRKGFFDPKIYWEKD